MDTFNILFLCSNVFILSHGTEAAPMNDCFSTSYQCNVHHTPKNVFAKISKQYGENNTLHLSGVHRYLYDVLEPMQNTAVLECCLQKEFTLNGYHLKSAIDYETFLELCPVMLQITNASLKISQSLEVKNNETPSLTTIWGYGILSVTVISLCSLVGISILPLMKKRFYNKVLLYLISLAVGTLCSNALFQLIPEGFGIDNDSMTVWCSSVIFGGFYMFYLFETILERLFRVRHDHGHLDAMSFGPEEGKCRKHKGNNVETIFNGKPDPLSGGDQQSGEHLLNTIDRGAIVTFPESNRKKSDSEEDNSTPCCWIFKNYKKIKTVAWMITIADGLHNFIDGLAIGASFSQSVVQGISASIAIFCEEFPHELGDFAILLSAGMSGKQAAFYNFASACCCYVGLCVGILVGHDVTAARWIFALAGGVFLYISLTGMLPEAQLQASSNELKDSPWTTLLIQNFGILSGFLVMFLLTVYKDEITLESP